MARFKDRLHEKNMDSTLLRSYVMLRGGKAACFRQKGLLLQWKFVCPGTFLPAARCAMQSTRAFGKVSMRFHTQDAGL